jgi:hypothetical protein
MCRLCDSPAAAVLAHRLASTRARVESKSEAAHPCPSLSGSLGQGSHGFFLQPPSSNREKPRRKRSERCRRRAHSPNLRQACQSRQLETLTGSCKGSAFRHTDAGVSVGWSRLYLTGLAVLLQDRPRPTHPCPLLLSAASSDVEATALPVDPQGTTSVRASARRSGARRCETACLEHGCTNSGRGG